MGCWRLNTSYFFETGAGRLRRNSLAARSRCCLARRASRSMATSTRLVLKTRQSLYSAAFSSERAELPFAWRWCIGTSTDDRRALISWKLSSLDVISTSTRSTISASIGKPLSKSVCAVDDVACTCWQASDAESRSSSTTVSMSCLWCPSAGTLHASYCCW